MWAIRDAISISLHRKSHSATGSALPRGGFEIFARTRPMRIASAIAIASLLSATAMRGVARPDGSDGASLIVNVQGASSSRPCVELAIRNRSTHEIVFDRIAPWNLVSLTLSRNSIDVVRADTIPTPNIGRGKALRIAPSEMLPLRSYLGRERSYETCFSLRHWGYEHLGTGAFEIRAATQSYYSIGAHDGTTFSSGLRSAVVRFRRR